MGKVDYVLNYRDEKHYFNKEFIEINPKQALKLQTQSLAGVSSEQIEGIRLEMTALECMKRVYTFMKRISREFVPQEIRD